MNHDSIIKVTDIHTDKVLLRSIYGLSIFDCNHVDRDPPQDPKVFLYALISSVRECTLHLGRNALQDLVDADDFPFASYKDSIIQSEVDIARGKFFDGYEVTGGLSSYFFPHVDTMLFQTKPCAELINYCFRTDSAVLYVGHRSISEPAWLPWEERFVSSEEWLSRSLDAFEYVISSSYDGFIINVRTKDLNGFEIMDECLRQTTDFVKYSDWYRKHAHELVWDEKECCLKLLPELRSVT